MELDHKLCNVISVDRGRGNLMMGLEREGILENFVLTTGANVEDLIAPFALELAHVLPERALDPAVGSGRGHAVRT